MRKLSQLTRPRHKPPVGRPTHQKSRILAYVRYIGPRFLPSVCKAFQNPIPELGHEDWSLEMRFSTILLLVAIAPCSLSAQTAGVPEIQYRSVPDFLNLPADRYFGEVAGVAVNSKGHIFVFSRGNTTGPAYAAAAAQLLEFGADGQFLREIGHNLYAWSYAHSVKIDPQDNIWVTDKGSDVVVKFTAEGRVSMVLGRKQEASDEGTGPLKHVQPPLPPEDGLFRQVTDVAWDSAGDTFISDGYINSRIAKVDREGDWLKSWGEP